jgi:hypothetical protein
MSIYDPKAPPFWERAKPGAHTKAMERQAKAARAIALREEYDQLSIKASMHEAELSCTRALYNRKSKQVVLLVARLTDIYERLEEIDRELQITRRLHYLREDSGSDSQYLSHAFGCDGNRWVSKKK